MSECPHGFETDRVTRQGLPLCPTCRHEVLLRRRFPDHPAYDRPAAIANDHDLFDQEDGDD
jgi:hypothetical protein